MNDCKDNTTIQNLISKLEETRKEFWNLPHESANFINMLIKISKAKRVLEIGTSNGYSGIWISKALQETGGKLDTIEFYQKRIDLAVENFKKADVLDIITIHQGSALNIIDEFEDNTFDFVFIDASKPEYLDYFLKLERKITKNAIILADNVTSHYKKVENFLNYVKNNENYQCELLNFDGGLFLIRKR